MTDRQFNALLRGVMTVSGTGRRRIRRLAPDKVRAADPAVVDRLVHHIVRRGEPSIEATLVECSTVDRSWLACCGYLYHGENAEYTFLCQGDSRTGGPSLPPPFGVVRPRESGPSRREVRGVG